MTFGTRVREYPVRGHTDAVVHAERALAEFQRRLFPISNRAQVDFNSFAPTLRAVENQNDYVVSAELPGVDSEDLSVAVEAGVLTLSGIRKSLDWAEDLDDDEKEALSTRFERSIRFNGEIDEERVTARSKNGLLRIVVPKPEPPVPSVITVPIELG